MPEFTVSGAEDSSVYLQKYAVSVKVIGNLSYTSIEMQVCNRSSRVLEATLNFTLPEGINVSDYALDINGKLREAVPVEKEKGTQVFESVERRRVDPGLLEKTGGNSFRTRIYPVNANGCRTIRIGYTQELIFSSSNALTYNLPLNFDEPIGHFSVDFKVYSKTNPEIASDCNTGMQFTKAEEVYNSHTEKNNFIPNGSFTMIIPKMTGGDEVQMIKANNDHYFLLNSYLQPKERARNIGNNICIIWDASLSGRYRNHTKEMELLDSLFQYRKNAMVQIFTISNVFKTIGLIPVSNGNTEDLKRALKKIVYDGAGELNKINTSGINADEFYLFSDGINSFSEAEPRFGRQPVFCVNAAVNSNYQRLKNWSNKTGGQYINLNEMYIKDAVGKIVQQPYQLISIRGAVSEVYPPLPVKAGADVCIAGISSLPNQEITLQFGYGNEITEEKKIRLNAATQATAGFDIEKAWAQKKINFLETASADNKAIITALGKKYGIVSEGTSLIVLELASDYIRYKIEPPAELKAAYDSLKKEIKVETKEKRDEVLQNAIGYAAELSQWSKIKPQVNPKPVVKPLPAVTNTTITQAARPGRDTSRNARTITGKITDDSGNAVAFASIKIKGYNYGFTSNANGTYSIRVFPNEIIQVSAVGFSIKEINPANSSSINITLEKSAMELAEVVVVGYGTQKKSELTYATASVKADEITSVPVSRSPNLQNALAGKVAGVQIHNQSNTSMGGETLIRLRGASSISKASGALYIIDGKVADGIDKLNPSDVKDVTILQGAAASVIFGNSASNGAIVITTKMNNDTLHNIFPGDTAVMDIKEWDPKREYLKEIEKAQKENYYTTYLQLREKYISAPVFYFDMANFFIAKGDKKTGLAILSNLAELGLEDAELFKMLGYKFKEQGDYEKEIYVFKKVLQWRPHEPQSFRDYALALADAGFHQRALDTLYTALTNEYEDDIMEDYEGIEEIIVTEINNLVNKYNLSTAKIDKGILLNNPVDIRIVLNWNMNNTDIDLWVTDPDDEKCYYGNAKTKLGGRISDDFTEGYGPEQFLLKKAKKGKYKIEIDYYGDDQKKIAGPTTIMAELYTHYGMPNQTKKIITIQLKDGNEGEFLVGNIEF